MKGVANKLLDFGISAYDANKDKLKGYVEKKSGEIVNNIVDKAVGSKMPESVKNVIKDNSSVINTVSQNVLKNLLNKADNYTRENIGEFKTEIGSGIKKKIGRPKKNGSGLKVL